MITPNRKKDRTGLDSRTGSQVSRDRYDHILDARGNIGERLTMIEASLLTRPSLGQLAIGSAAGVELAGGDGEITNAPGRRRYGGV